MTARVRQGVGADFDDFAAASASGLARAAYLLTGDVQDAEDLVQETLLKVFRHWRRVSQTENRGAYTHRMLVNEFLSGRRRRRVACSPVAEEHLNLEDPKEDIASVVARREVLANAVAALPPRERLAVVLRHYLHLSHTEIAEAMGTAESTARSNVSRGIDALRGMLSETTNANEVR